MAQVPAGKNRSGQLSKQTGDAWENQARRWLEGQGLRFIAANARERGGEIDLIMRDGAVTVFVEVRYRRSARYGENGSFETVDCRFDVVAFTGNDIQWLKNAFGE
ncbi:MAG: YraN family protein [Klebsiella sp.]|nr:YraN family protein [Klebsiella sp.]MDU2305335.1 YraN family protein [Klebsiella sp.]